ncbi:amino acid transporter [Mycena polygramma]|nr:amino acid transporter [Mycena polygramma]
MALPAFDAKSKTVDDATLLGRLGYKQELKREFTTLEMFGFGFTISSIVPSTASVLFYSLPNDGPSAMVWGWATSSVVSTTGPTNTSPRYRNVLCWMVSYTNAITYISGVGVGWSGATAIMAAGSIGSDGNFVPTDNAHNAHIQRRLFAILTAYGVSASCATRVLARLQSGAIALNILLVLVTIVALPAATPAELKNNAKYAFGSFGNCVHISEEVRNANITVPWAIVSATGVGTTLGFGVQVALAFCSSAVWGLLISYSRQIFAFSRDGALLFSPVLYDINPTTGTPFRCVGFSVTSAALLGLITFAGPAATSAIFSMGVAGQYVGNSIPIAARLLGGQQFKRGPFNLGAFSVPVAVIAVLWMAFMIVALMFPTAPDPTTQTMNYSVVVLGGVLFLALCYYYFPRYGGVHWFQGPVANVDLGDEEVKVVQLDAGVEKGDCGAAS